MHAFGFGFEVGFGIRIRLLCYWWGCAVPVLHIYLLLEDTNLSANKNFPFI